MFRVRTASLLFSNPMKEIHHHVSCFLFCSASKKLVQIDITCINQFNVPSQTFFLVLGNYLSGDSFLDTDYFLVLKITFKK